MKRTRSAVHRAGVAGVMADVILLIDGMRITRSLGVRAPAPYSGPPAHPEDWAAPFFFSINSEIEANGEVQFFVC
jgi:hypothetical protein